MYILKKYGVDNSIYYSVQSHLIFYIWCNNTKFLANTLREIMIEVINLFTTFLQNAEWNASYDYKNQAFYF
jgi:hypothetical protein